MKDKTKAFTLIELLVVVAIIGILSVIGVVAFSGFTEKAKENSAKSNHQVVVKFITTTMHKSNFNGGYFEQMYPNWPTCDYTIKQKITPSTVDSVSKKFMTHLRCLIKTHPFNDPVYPAVNWGPRGILGTVEFQNKCVDSKPVIEIVTKYNSKNENLVTQILMSDYNVSCY
jgi:prepilin-type N-terminal cleavage/methylation domain-containing protein